MMRVSSGMMINHYMNQINTSYANQAKLMEQSDGSNLHRASDDSVRYSRYLTYQNRDTENLQYQDNVKAGSSWMKTSDAAMVNMTDIYTTLKEKTVDAANDTNNDSDLITAIAKEFKAKLYEMVSLGNNQLGDRYIFAGQSDLTQPFQISTEEKDRGLIKVLDDPQSRFFSNPDDTKNLNVDDTGDLKQFLEVNDTEGNRYFVNTQNGKIYTEDFIMNGYKDKLKEHIEYVQEGDEYATLPFFDTDALNVAGYFENTGVKRVEGKVTLPTSTVKSGQTVADLKALDVTSSDYDDASIVANASLTFKIPQDDGTYEYRILTQGNNLLETLKEVYPDADIKVGIFKNETDFAAADADTTFDITTYNNSVISDKATEPTTYSYGQKIDLSDGARAIADSPVYVVDKYGNTRIVAKGNEISLDYAKAEEAFVGVPLSATKYESGKVLSLGSTSTYPEIEPALKFKADDEYTLDTYEYAIADADIEYYTSGSTVGVTVKAGDLIPSGVTVKFLTDNTSMVRDPKLVNGGEVDEKKPNQDRTYLSSLKSGLTSTYNNTSIIADTDVTFRYPHYNTQGTIDYYTYNFVSAGNELNASLADTDWDDFKIGHFTNDTDYNNGNTSDTTKVTIYFHNTLVANETNTGEVIMKKEKLKEGAQGAYLESLQSAIDTTYKNDAITADKPVTFKSTDSSGNETVETFPPGTKLNDYIKNATAIKVGTYASVSDFDSDIEEGGNGELTADITVYHNDGAVTLPSADVMIKNENGDARLVKAGNPITLEDGETEAVIIGKPTSNYFYSGFTTIKQPIVTYQGDPKYISMVKLNGTVDQMADTVNVTGQDLNGSNIFDDANSGNQTQLMSNGRLCYASSGTAMINDMFTVCAKLEHGDRKWMRTDGITVADKAHEVVTMTQSTMAARQNVYDSVEQMLTKQNETITNDINNVSATDVAELAVKMMQAQTIYNMALSVGSRIIPPTLADYL